MNKKRRNRNKKNTPILNINSKSDFPLLTPKSSNVLNSKWIKHPVTIYTKAVCGEKILNSFPKII